MRKLNPNPGVQFAKYSVPTVTPDITVDQADDGTYRIVFEDACTPRLNISEHYRQRMLTGKATPAEQDWIKKQDQRGPMAD